MNSIAVLCVILPCLLGSDGNALAQVPAPSPQAGATACGPDVRVEAFFQQHLAALAHALQQREPLSLAERQFVYLVIFLSGANTPVESYTGRPILQPADVDAYRTWYDQHRDRISWRHVTELQEWLAAPLVSEEQVGRMKSFRIK
ncbi:hypothetical protein I2I05_11670 [Hymenobacter sp. BT683]|uniref:Uncharacterized protein n=1 Tax=Hymenobacter jeongseonensis TaxID=2791027 RepID=A0ABS0II60_9BACT|nr:hypothetical protein [Hymenobacter jeongseonensis]MBF9238053.1 hypothetical protein [Hymenobacter jeongseonensis]